MKVLITGANRGIGLEMTRILAARGDTVFATARNPRRATELNAIEGDVFVIQLDVTDLNQIQVAFDDVHIETDSLDVIINNAAILNRDNRLETLSFEESLYTMRVNAVGPVIVARTFLPLLRNGGNRRLANITSQLGSLWRKESGGMYDYCASKAALNMYTRTLAADLKSDGITTVMIHPGWVQTDMGGKNADLTPVESAEAIIELVDNLTPEMNGKFYRQDGTEHPW